MAEHKLWSALHKLQQEPDSPTKAAAAAELVRAADASGERELQIAARTTLVDSGTFGGAEHQALVAFAWLLAQYDQDPSSQSEYDLLWKYKWILGSATSFPSISLERLAALHDDFDRRLQAHGYTLRPSYNLRMRTAFATGRPDEGRHWRDLWKKTKRDALADCRACELDSDADAAADCGDDEAAVKQALAVIHGRQQCMTVPMSTYASILPPLIRLGRLDEARELSQIGYPLVARKPQRLGDIGDHLLCDAMLANFQRGLRILQQHAATALSSPDPADRRYFLHAAALLVERLAATRPRPRKLRLPDSLACHRPDGVYAPAEVAVCLRAEADRLAGEFDRRNGNDHYARLFAADRELLETLQKNAAK